MNSSRRLPSSMTPVGVLLAVFLFVFVFDLFLLAISGSLSVLRTTLPTICAGANHSQNVSPGNGPWYSSHRPVPSLPALLGRDATAYRLQI